MKYSHDECAAWLVENYEKVVEWAIPKTWDLHRARSLPGLRVGDIRFYGPEVQIVSNPGRRFESERFLDALIVCTLCGVLDGRKVDDRDLLHRRYGDSVEEREYFFPIIELLFVVELKGRNEENSVGTILRQLARYHSAMNCEQNLKLFTKRGVAFRHVQSLVISENFSSPGMDNIFAAAEVLLYRPRHAETAN